MAVMLARLILFFVGGVVGAWLDHLHVSFGVLGYPAPVLFDQPVWVVPLFGSAALILVLGHALFRNSGEARPTLPQVTSSIATFTLAYFATAAGNSRPNFILLLLTASWGLLAAGPGFRKRALYCVAIAAGGTLFEIFLSRVLGGFAYRVDRPLGGVPIWLPALYLHAALLTRQLDLAFFAPRQTTTGNS